MGGALEVDHTGYTPLTRRCFMLFYTNGMES